MRLRRTLLLLTVLPVMVATVAPSMSASSQAAPRTATAGGPSSHRTSDDPTSARDETARLQPHWRASRDELWTLRGDATGLHLLMASARSAYSWRTVTTLSEPGVETDRWVGNACLTGSGRYAVVVYAPRSFTNQASLFLRGGRVAVVDLATGAVRKPDVSGSLAYYDPGCGLGDDAVLTQSRFPEESGRSMATKLLRVHAGTGRVDKAVTEAGQLSSAVPVGKDIVATRGAAIVRIAATGAVHPLVAHSQGAFRLSVESDGRVVYLSGDKAHNQVSRVAPDRSAPHPEVLARRSGAWLGLRSGTGGRVFVLGDRTGTTSFGHGTTEVAAAANDEMSTHGEAVLVHSTMPSPSTAPRSWAARQTLGKDHADQVSLQARVRSTGRTLDFALRPGLRPAPRAATGMASTATSAPSTAAPRAVSSGRMGAAAVGGTTESSATCAVPRNDPKTQVYQPTPRQVEWAADEAVVNNLKTARPANWKQSGLASWAPQTVFPSKALSGGGRVPVQILLGILAQESNLWQASGHALSGEFGNPLVGDYYGRGSSGWTIDYSKADCGYGVGQVTDGMRKADATTTADRTKQREIAMDYETNIARSLQILQDKWNQTHDAGLVHDNGDPSSIENWVYAVWAYNTGFYPNKGDGSPWGVGWFNNPANPVYPANRGFFDYDPADPSHPADWPYEEKVVGWAAFSIATPDGPGFRTAWWVSESDRLNAKPPIYTFCDSSNHCAPGSNPCPAVDSTCWWHKPVTYNDCRDGYCGHELLRFNSTYPEQPDGTNYPPSCTLNGLPSGSLIVDDVSSSIPSARTCAHPWTDKGSFALSFASASGRIDFHQIGGGFGGHFWFAHTRTAAEESGTMQVTGTWTYTTQLTNQWGTVFVHLPDHGAETQQAAYKINRGDGTSETRYALQRVQANQWVSLGALKFNGYPSISLSSQTWDGSGSDDVAFDAVAIKPLSAKPKDVVVALGDSYASGEGANDSSGGDDYYKESDYGGEYGEKSPVRNACHRSPYAWSRKATLADSTTPIGNRQSSFDPTMDFHLIACSGAESENLLPFHTATGTPPRNASNQTGVGQYGEVSQLDKGYLDSSTTLVMFSIGGNDAQFGPIIKACASPIDIGADCLEANTTGAGPNRTAVPDLIRTKVKSSVLTVARQIHARAPNAKIVLMGYPELISDSGQCVNVGAINDDEASWIDDMSLVMDNALAEDVATLQGEGVKVEIGAPIGDFTGKGVCGSPEDINGVVLNRTAGDVPVTSSPVSQQSFHPKIDGTTLYADAANRALRSLGL